MAINGKRRIQVQIDKDLADETEQILNQLGLTPTTAITMLFRQIVARGGLPFDVTLTDREKNSLAFLKESADTPVHKLTTAKHVQDWLDDPDED